MTRRVWLQRRTKGGSVEAVPDASYRIRPSVVRDAIAEQCGTENGLVVYARHILAPRPHDTGTGRHGQAGANTWARAAKGQHFAARTERTRRVPISGENGYFCI